MEQRKKPFWDDCGQCPFKVLYDTLVAVRNVTSVMQQLQRDSTRLKQRLQAMEETIKAHEGDEQ